MNFGWAKWVSELLLTVMNVLHAWVKSYALAIIIMTIIIRSLLWPLQNAATKSMRKMSKLSPIMNELRVKYKDDPQRMNQETMKLYKEYGVNPFGGCLPMVVQIPIFFGFYGMLDKAIELRNSSFLWVHDLSQRRSHRHQYDEQFQRYHRIAKHDIYVLRHHAGQSQRTIDPHPDRERYHISPGYGPARRLLQ